MIQSTGPGEIESFQTVHSQEVIVKKYLFFAAVAFALQSCTTYYITGVAPVNNTMYMTIDKRAGSSDKPGSYVAACNDTGSELVCDPVTVQELN